MIIALNAVDWWAPVLALALVGVLALAGAAVCLVLIIRHKKKDKEPAAEGEAAAEPPAPVAEEIKAEEEIGAHEEEVEEKSAEDSEAFAEPETALYEEPAAAVEEVAEEPVPEPVEEVAEELVPEPVEEVAEEPVPEPVEEVAEEPATEPVEEVAEEPAPEPVEEVAEEPAPEPVEEVAEEPVPEPVKEETPKTVPLIVRRTAPDGKVFIKVRYNRSYTAKLIQSDDSVKNYYTEIKNELMRYKVSNRISWRYETFRRGRKLLVKLAVRGKSLYVYFALDPENYAGTKYKINDVSHMTSNAGVPTLYKIKNDRRCRYAKQLIADVMAANGLEAGAERNDDYASQYPYEEIEPLVERRLVKLLEWEEAAPDSEVGVIAVPVEELPENAVEAAEEIAVTSEEEEPAPEPVEEVAEEPVPEPVEEVEEEPEEEPVPEPAEELEEEPEEEPAGVSVAEAEEKISDEEAESYVIVGHKYSDKTKKAVINIDTLGRYFKAGETVTVDEIRKRVPDIGKRVTYIKVLARGTLDKALTVEADDFSPAAIKMIVLTGGQVIRTRTNIN